MRLICPAQRRAASELVSSANRRRNMRPSRTYLSILLTVSLVVPSFKSILAQTPDPSPSESSTPASASPTQAASPQASASAEIAALTIDNDNTTDVFAPNDS